MILHDKLFIDNSWVETENGGKTDVFNPADNAVIGQISLASEKDVVIAIDVAQRSFSEGRWHKKPLLERSSILHRIGDLIDKNKEEFAQIETLNVGKPITESRYIDVPSSSDTFHYFADILTSMESEVIPSSIPGILDYTIYEPMGVVGAIIPWNFPLLIASRKIASALAAGNCIVMKPSTTAPFSTLRLADILKEAGVPEGVVNVITGSGEMVGGMLTKLPSVKDITFTGSTVVGQKLLSCCAETIKGVGLELGGKSPALVLADADIEETLAGILFGIYLNQGECCCAATRILVDNKIYDRFIPLLVRHSKALRVGIPQDEKTQMGPLINKEHLKKVLGYIEKGKKEGAKILCGGIKSTGNKLDTGNFLAPTLFADVTSDMSIFQEEIFGPVATITRCEDIEQMILLANNSRYGLAASIWTTNLKSGHNVAQRLQAGTIWLNLHNFVLPMAPYGGYKASGLGRELGKLGVRSLMQTKNIMINLMEKPFKWY